MGKKFFNVVNFIVMKMMIFLSEWKYYDKGKKFKKVIKSFILEDLLVENV